jgi:hypothetical protein
MINAVANRPGEQPEELDLADMAQSIAAAIYDNVRPEGEGWDDLSADEKADFLDVAKVAMAAHAAYFASHKIRVLHPNCLPMPACRDEASAMVSVGSAYLAKNPPKIIRATSLPQ